MTQPAESTSTGARGPSLLRALGPGMAIAVVVGNVIGSGIYVKPGGIARDAGDFRVILAAWVIGGLICLVGSLCLAELGAMLPSAGGIYVYLREAYGRPVAFLFGWTDFLFSKPASIGALTVVFVGMVTKERMPLNPWAEVAVESAVIAVIAWINILGVIWGGRLQAVTTIAKALFLAGVALLPFFAAEWLSVPLAPDNLASSVTPAKGTLPTAFAAALLGVLWAYNGWESLGTMAEEIREPQRNIPRALFGGLGILIVLYVSATVAYHLALPMSALVAAGDHGAERMCEVLLGKNGALLMAAGIMLSTFGGINSNMLLGPRVSFAMGRDGVFFRSLGWVHASYRTPAFAIFVQAAMAVALVLGSSVLVQVYGWEHTVFDILTDYVVFASSIFYALAVIAVMILRRRRPDLPRPYRTLGYPVAPIVYVLFYCWFLFEVYRGDPRQANIGLGLIALGIPVYFTWQILYPPNRAVQPGERSA
ncbi:MAG TPA: amino acid permease [Planctomycetaceae bacterium]|jgi:APA family basic amino acid/polyamine antiporter|nr:amino acid permease [Planctomycetaceae bacterium]